MISRALPDGQVLPNLETLEPTVEVVSAARFGHAVLQAVHNPKIYDDFAWYYVGDPAGEEPLPPLLRFRSDGEPVSFDLSGPSWYSDTGTLIYTRRTSQVFPKNWRDEMIPEHWFVALADLQEGTIREYLAPNVEATTRYDYGLSELRIMLDVGTVLCSSRKGTKFIHPDDSREPLYEDVRNVLKGMNAYRALIGRAVTIAG